MSNANIDSFNSKLVELRGKLPDFLLEKGLDVRNGKKICCINPEHNDRNPSMSMYETEHGYPVVHCFGCSAHYDIFNVSHIFDNRPIVGPGFFHDNVRFLADKYKIDIPLRQLSEEEIYEMNTYNAYALAAEYISGCEFGTLQLEELNKRQWDEKFVKGLQIGSCDNYNKFRNYMKGHGYSAKFLDEIDLNNEGIFSPNNLIFTIHDEKGSPVGFSARNLRFDGEKDDNGRLISGPKFRNSKTTNIKCNIYRKSERLYLLHKVKSLPVFIFEGYGDVVTAKQNGLENVCGIGSLELSEHHLNTLRKRGYYDIVICLDSDDSGIKKAKVLLDEVLKSIHDLRIRFIFLPPVEITQDGKTSIVKVDPDIFIREKGIKEFLSLPKQDPFTWRLQEFQTQDDIDAETICMVMIPIIACEPSAIRRDRMIKELSEYTGYNERVINDEIQKLFNTDEARIQHARDAIIDDVVNKLKARKDSPEILLQRAMDDFYAVEKEHNSGKIDKNALLSEMLAIKQYGESQDYHQSINLGPHFRDLQNALSGDLRQKFIMIGGTANTGKTSLLVNLAWAMATYNDDLLPIFLTIDDSGKELTPRFITHDISKRAIESKNTDMFDNIEIDKAARVIMYKDQFEYEAILQERENAWGNLMQYFNNDKLVIVDSEKGKSIDFINYMIKTLSEKHPEKRVMMFVDNFHLVSIGGYDEGRGKYKALSGAMKDICKKYDATIICTVEYTKIPKGQKPSNNNIAESVALEYDSNCIIHLYSHMHDYLEESDCYFTSGAEQKKYPLIEMIVGKNKISSFKGSLWSKFWPEKVMFSGLSPTMVKNIRDANKAYLHDSAAPAEDS